MNAIDRAIPGAPSTMTGTAPRIRYLDPAVIGAGLPAELDRAAALGFTAAMVPPPWAPGASGNRFLPARLNVVSDALGGGPAEAWVTGFSRQCRSAGLDAMLDVPFGALAPEFEGAADPFGPVPPADVLDPRRGAPVLVRPLADPAAAGAWWGHRLAALAQAGMSGFRVLGLESAPEAMASLREAVAEAVLIAWTPGMAREAVAKLQGASYVVSSLAWWDCRAEWFWDELAILRRVAPVLACPEVPFGERATADLSDPAQLGAALRRLAGLATATASGWLVPSGFETGARRPMDVRGHAPLRERAMPGLLDLAASNAALAQGLPHAGLQVLTAGSPLAVLRTDAADARFARRAALVIVNTDLNRPRSALAGEVLPQIDGAFEPFAGTAGMAFAPGSAVTLAPGEMAAFTTDAVAMTGLPAPLDAQRARAYAEGPRIALESPSPCVDAGSLPVKRLVGETVIVEVDAVCDGHEKLGVALRWRGPGAREWHEVRMEPVGNDRFRAEFPLAAIGAYEYDVQGWRDAFATYRDEISKKSVAGVDVTLELREGMALLQRTASRVGGAVQASLQALHARLTGADDASRLAAFLSAEVAAQMAAVDDRPRLASLPHPVRLDAERSGAAFAAWYEVFPRSMSDDPARHGTFRDVERHLPRVRAMGFDVLYFPPVHPIGRINRKGPNNTLTPGATDPGSPYAIGSAEGGYDTLHPELGTVDDFRHLVAEAATHGIEIAVDFAIQCSPDHPWLQEHKEWFDWRPDGTIKYAENPPKKYQDIVNVDFYKPGAIPGLWLALAEAVLFWMKLGVRLIRVDNPHTKPLPFWEWMIAEVKQRYPDAVFLAEAFTRPKVMYRLAKVGFGQSYTYFTWRETKREMEAYLTELAQPGPRDFFRPHFFVNTPDINPVYLQGASRSAYLSRAALAATMSGLWGVYCGFELCEGTPLPGREEYLDSEKYQIRAWDWDRPGNIVPEITALNRIRHANPALRSHLTTTFLPAGNDQVSVYLKATPDKSNALVVAVSYDAGAAQESGWEFPFWLWQADENAAFEAEDLFTGERTIWRNKQRTVRLEPARPYTIWRVSALS